MSHIESNAGEIALELMDVAEQLIECGEDFEDVHAAFVAVSVRMRQLRDEADDDARNVILRLIEGG